MGLNFLSRLWKHKEIRKLYPPQSRAIEYVSAIKMTFNELNKMYWLVYSAQVKYYRFTFFSISGFLLKYQSCDVTL